MEQKFVDYIRHLDILEEHPDTDFSDPAFAYDYNEVQELENQYETAQRNLETAKSNLELAELNYSLGRNTALDVTKAELDVEEAENTLAQIVYSHDMKVYQLENTELL